MGSFRFKSSLEEYDIKSLYEVYNSVRKIKNMCILLEGYGNELKKDVVKASEDFTTINFNRIEEATTRFIKKLNYSVEEMDDLVKSCEEFIEKIQMIWK